MVSHRGIYWLKGFLLWIIWLEFLYHKTQSINPLFLEGCGCNSWRCQDIEMLSAFQALCEGNQQVSGGFPSWNDNHVIFFYCQLEQAVEQLLRHCDAHVISLWCFKYILLIFRACPMKLTYWCSCDIAVMFQIHFTDISSMSYEIDQWWTPQGQLDDNSILVKIMARCHQAPSHYLNQCWQRFMTSWSTIGPQTITMFAMLIRFF